MSGFSTAARREAARRSTDNPVFAWNAAHDRARNLERALMAASLAGDAMRVQRIRYRLDVERAWMSRLGRAMGIEGEAA